MVLKKLRNVRKNLMSGEKTVGSGKEEYIEVDVGGFPGEFAPLSAPHGKMDIIIESVKEFGDTERVLKHVREGRIVLMKVKALKEKDLGELKRVVERFKRTILAQNGDIVGIEQDWLLLVPSHVTVHR
ncbi:MAG: cell division protein SepF [Candidatus Aenigmarchaeota archaeon]|nr:cell division protein SepF [Candidatus Aenigmarchaeota archaeon]